MLCLFWVDKFLILRHYSKPPRYSQELNDNFIALLPYAAIFHCGFSLYMIGCEDIFPEKFYEQDGMLYAYDRVISIPGVIYLGIIIVGIIIILYMLSSNCVFDCKTEQKQSTVIPEEKDDSEISSQECKFHGLHSYNLLNNPKYCEQISALNNLTDSKSSSRYSSKRNTTRYISTTSF